jgi:D-amino-acid oxidase
VPEPLIAATHEGRRRVHAGVDPRRAPVTGRRDVTVVGAGVIGLTCALRLAEAGVGVRVVARDRREATTSSVAAAMWYPYRAFPFERVLGWAAVSYAEFAHLARRGPAAAVQMRAGTELLRDDGPAPWWASAVPDLAKVAGHPQVPAGFAIGWRFTAPIVDMSRYLPWLESRLADRGVVPEREDLADLADSRLGAVVVDCAGLGARTLVPDPSVTPVRGQVVVVEQIGLDEWVVDDGDGRQLTYVVPRVDDVVVGGTAEEGADDLAVDDATAVEILERATALVPALAEARIVRHKVGLRPARPTVRLDAEERGGRTVVHCYGHGGAGVTLSWGCAADVVDLVLAAPG